MQIQIIIVISVQLQPVCLINNKVVVFSVVISVLFKLGLCTELVNCWAFSKSQTSVLLTLNCRWHRLCSLVALLCRHHLLCFSLFFISLFHVSLPFVYFAAFIYLRCHCFWCQYAWQWNRYHFRVLHLFFNRLVIYHRRALTARAIPFPSNDKWKGGKTTLHLCLRRP